MSSRKKLDRLMTTLEDGLLRASDKELLALPGASESARRMQRLISSKSSTIEESIAVPIPQDSDSQRNLLALVMRSQNVPSELRMAFKDGRKISDDEVSLMLRKLMRAGVLSSRKAKPK
jgi:hypothetical protein